MLGVRDAAAALGVSVQRVHALVRSGRLPARRVGRLWVIEESALSSVAARRPGRPVSAANAWALLAMLCSEDPGWIDPSVGSRLRRRSRDGEWLERALRASEPRARIVLLRVLPGDLDRISADAALVRSGLCAGVSALDVVARREEPLDAYAPDDALRRIERRYRPIHFPADPNLVLRVPSHAWILARGPIAPPVVVAADLLLGSEPRVERAARRLLREIVG